MSVSNRTGYIYKITDKENGKIYIGQTCRDIETRFMEHYWDNGSNSLINKAMKKKGYRNFSYEKVEEVSLDKLDERERYWIKECNSTDFDIGYNISIKGKWSPCEIGGGKLLVEENELVFQSCEEAIKLLHSLTNWSPLYLKARIDNCVKGKSNFFGYHLKHISISNENVSDLSNLEDWVKSLNFRHQGKNVWLKELDKHFDTVASAARYCLENNIISAGPSKAPIQVLVTKINLNISGKIDFVTGTNEEEYHFFSEPGIAESETPSQKMQIYCPQLDKIFDSQEKCAGYFLDNKIVTGIKKKTLVSRIGDVVKGNFIDYKGYTFQSIE